jgi:hypothetical protein
VGEPLVPALFSTIGFVSRLIRRTPLTTGGAWARIPATRMMLPATINVAAHPITLSAVFICPPIYLCNQRNDP